MKKVPQFSLTYSNDKKYISPEDDPKCKYNGEFVIADCYCKYPDFYVTNKEKYNLSQDQINSYNLYCFNQLTSFPNDKVCQAQTPETLNINCYCKYPTAYQNKFFGLTQEQINRMDGQCQQIATSRRNYLRPPNLKSKIVNKIKTYGERLGNIALGFLQPQNLAQMGIFKLAEEFLPSIARLVGQVSIEFLTYLLANLTDLLTPIAEIASESLMALIPELLTEALGAMAGTAGVLAAETSVFLSSFMDFLPAIDIPGIDVVVAGILAFWGEIMMTGMLIDFFFEDIYGYSNMVNGEFLVEFSNKMNDFFLQMVIQNVRLPEGENWPIEFFADRLLFGTKLDDKTKIKYESLELFYIFEYVQSLTYNSRGEFIYPLNLPPVNKNQYVKNIQDLDVKDDLQSGVNSLFYLYSNDNTSAVIFLKKNWLIILIIILVIIIFIIFIK